MHAIPNVSMNSHENKKPFQRNCLYTNIHTQLDI